MSPSQPPTISLQPPSDVPDGDGRVQPKRGLSAASCVTDTRSCPDLLDGGHSPRRPSPPKARQRSAVPVSRSYTDLSGDLIPEPYGANTSRMKRALMTGNTTSQKRLEMELQKLSVQQMKKAEELTLKKLDFLESAFRKSLAVATTTLENGREALERGVKGTPSPASTATNIASRRSSRHSLPLLSPERGSLVAGSRCSTARARSAAPGTTPPGAGSPENQPSPPTISPRQESAASTINLPFLTVSNVKAPAARPLMTPSYSRHNRRLMREGETKNHLLESNMVSAIQHAGHTEAAPRASQEDNSKTLSCMQDERFTRLRDSLVPMWQTSSWDERVEANGAADSKPPFTGTDGRFKTVHEKRCRGRDTFGVGLGKPTNARAKSL